MTYQIKKILDYINERLNELTNVKNSQIDALIIRAYNVPERLVEEIFCVQHYEDDFILEIVKFLSEFPP